MKKRGAWFAPVVVIATIAVVAAIVYGVIMAIMGQSGIQVAESDVKNVIHQCVPYLAGVLVVIVAACVACAVFQNKSAKARVMVYGQSVVAGVLALVLAVNAICLGPEYALLSQSLADTKSLSAETAGYGTEVMGQIGDEGIVLLKNEDDYLPLGTKTSKLNVFGWSSINPTYGGTGSGASNSANAVSLLQGLQDAGYEINEDLVSFYQDFLDPEDAPVITLASQDWTIVQPTIADYDDAGIFAGAKDFSDTALVVISRSGGENADLPTSITDEDTLEEGGYGEAHVYTTYADDVNPEKSYLDLSNREEAMVERVCSEFENVIVVINANNAMELGWVNDYASIKGVLYMAGAGEQGFESLGRILSGEVNPSGRLVDTYLYNNLDAPYANNIGDFRYDNSSELLEGDYADKFVSFVNYVEGIYVGYRWWETADAEGVVDYDAEVLYPFGYGLSYTEFDEEIANITDDGTTITLDVTVTNTGDVAGKQVVEVYYTPPYTNGGIEKSAVNLVEFAKTNLLEPGDSQTITITFDYEDMASYDYNGVKAEGGAYVLEAGDYEISLRNDAHTVVDAETVTVGDDVIYNDANDGARSSDETTATNQFDFVEGDVTYLSRADHFANYGEATAAPSTYTMPEDQVETFMYTGNYDVDEHQDDSATMPTTDAENGLTINDMVGLDYDDPKWDELLDQLSVDEMEQIVAYGGYSNSAVESIDFKGSTGAEGVSGISNMFTGEGGQALPVSTMTACTWNVELAQERGKLTGMTATDLGVSETYCPSMNTHRSAFDGRNFEYYSEDPVLAGKIAAQEVMGATSQGLIMYMKHFALNDQETNRNNMICTWSNEQAMREIYLKTFEITVKEGGVMGAMSSFNYLGTRFAGACNELLNTVLRGEWGFHGAVVTDWFADYGYMVSDDIVRNGGDKMLTVGTDSGELVDTTSATAVSAIRTASHNVLYTVANSNALSMESELATWEKAFIGVDIALAVILVAAEVALVRKYKKLENDSVEGVQVAA